MSFSSVQILDGGSVSGAYGVIHAPVGVPMVFQAVHGALSSGTGTATVTIYGSLEENPSRTALTGWTSLGTIASTLSTTATTGSLAVTSPWRYVKAFLTGIAVPLGQTGNMDVWIGTE